MSWRVKWSKLCFVKSNVAVPGMYLSGEWLEVKKLDKKLTMRWWMSVLQQKQERRNISKDEFIYCNKWLGILLCPPPHLLAFHFFFSFFHFQHYYTFFGISIIILFSEAYFDHVQFIWFKWTEFPTLQGWTCHLGKPNLRILLVSVISS